MRRFSSGSTRVTFSRCSDHVFPTSVQTGAKQPASTASDGIVLRGDVAPAGHPEGGYLGVLETLSLQHLEQLDLLWIGARKACLDVMHAEAVERVGHAQLLVHGQGHALALHPVAEGGVVEVDLLWPLG